MSLLEWIADSIAITMVFLFDPFLWIIMLFLAGSANHRRQIYLRSLICSIVLEVMVFGLQLMHQSGGHFVLDPRRLIARYIASLAVGLVVWWLRGLKNRLDARSPKD